jgi:hypothetical protein
MKKPLAAALGLAFVVTFYPAVAPAAATCADVEAAKSLLKKQTVAMKSTQTPRSLAGARSQDVQAPRSQDIQAPRSQDIQAPRSQDIQAPRSQDIQAPRSQDIQAPRSQDTQAPRSGELKQAATLVKEADAACKAGNSSLATVKANAAMELMNK